ncbi:MAG: hypothetical protein AAGM38_05460, partial [Pseudomonadota bacterium]
MDYLAMTPISGRIDPADAGPARRLGAGPLDLRRRLSDRFIGRQGVLAQLAGRLSAETGGVIAIEGAVGIGKSRLVEEALALWRRSGGGRGVTIAHFEAVDRRGEARRLLLAAAEAVGAPPRARSGAEIAEAALAAGAARPW